MLDRGLFFLLELWRNREKMLTDMIVEEEFEIKEEEPWYDKQDLENGKNNNFIDVYFERETERVPTLQCSSTPPRSHRGVL